MMNVASRRSRQPDAKSRAGPRMASPSGAKRGGTPREDGAVDWKSARRLFDRAYADHAHDEAGRIIKKAQADGWLPGDDELHDWLLRHEGKRFVAHVVQSFAATRCFYCERGLEPCAECADSDGMPDGFCFHCLGAGRVNCQCCNGSRLVDVKYIPSSLRASALKWRAAAIERVWKKLGEAAPLSAPGGEASATDRKAACEQALRRIARVNRVLGGLENVLTALRRLPDSELDAETRRSIEAHCLRAGRQADAALHRCVEVLADAWRDRSGDAIEPGPPAPLKEMAASHDLTGTHLSHPILNRALSSA